MINCTYLGIDEELVFRTIIEEKYNPGKTRLRSNANRVIAMYNQYLHSFPSLERKSSSEFSTTEVDEKAALQLCYSSPTSSFENLKGLIISKQPDQLKAFCPYCLIDKPKTLDHYIGQTEFPEYSILIKNLIPCCYDCNQKKGEIWRRNRKRRFIHYYNDTFFQHRFLFAKIVYHRGDSTPTIHYGLKKPLAINKSNFRIIKSHFNDLDLINEYNKRANTIVSAEVDVMKQARADGESKQKIIESLKRSFIAKTKKFGQNYWEAIMYETLATTSKLLNSL